MPGLEAAASFSRNALDDCFGFLKQNGRMIVAVSGGPDSMALMNLLALWNAENGIEFLIATVDHGLRPESRQEAFFVAEQAERLGFPHHLLAWDGEKPETGLQEAARQARYDLLTALVRQENAQGILTAHTRDDQAETILMRLARGSGIGGLAGMQKLSHRNDISIIRPLIDSPKSALIAACRDHHWAYIDDPSNRDPIFTRIRWRMLMPLLAQEGLDAERLALFGKRAKRADEALAQIAAEKLAEAALAESVFKASFFVEAPFEIALHMLIRAMKTAGAESLPQKLEKLERFLAGLRAKAANHESLRGNLAGLVLSLDSENRLTIAPEPPRKRANG